jgi:hypothetical protein
VTLNWMLIPVVVIGLSAAARSETSPTAEQIVAHHLEARGGIERIHALHSLIYHGSYREGEHSSEASMALMRPFYKLVGDPEKPSTDFSEGYDGSSWEFYGDPGIVVRTVGAAAAASRHGVAIGGPLVDYREKGSTVELRGTVKIGDRQSYWLRVRMRDGFEEDEFVDSSSWMLIAERKVAPIHAFGRPVATESRFGDFRPVAGVQFAFSDSEVEIATGKVLNEMQWKEIVPNRELDPVLFSPPVLQRTPVQTLIDHLFLERDDLQSVLWSYSEFRRAYPDVDTDVAMQVAGYQILKMGDVASAAGLLEANTVAYPRSSTAFFGLGRAYSAAGRMTDARAAWTKSIALDPTNKRSRDALDQLAKTPGR